MLNYTALQLGSAVIGPELGWGDDGWLVEEVYVRLKINTLNIILPYFYDSANIRMQKFTVYW